MNNFVKVLEGKSLSFPWSLLPVPTVSALHNVLSAKESGQFVWVKAKVLSIANVKTIYSPTMRKNLIKTNIIIADETATMQLCLWENLIRQVELQQAYLFTNIKVSFFKNKYFTLQSTSAINRQENIEISAEIIDEATLLESGEDEKTGRNVLARILFVEARILFVEARILCVEARILCVEVNQSLMCINCQNSIYETNQNHGKQNF